MSEDATRSPELDAVRALLFPQLSERDGWALIDRADELQRDPARWERIEELARRDAATGPTQAS